MASNRIHKFSTAVQAQYFMNGAVLGKPMPINSQNGPGWYGLVGKTLILVAPGATITFVAGTGPDPSLLQLADVKAQIETAVAGLLVTTAEQQLVIIERTPTTGVVIGHTGTANSILGFDIQSNTVGKVYAPPGSASPIAAPAWTAYGIDVNAHMLITFE
jgi:hypothetical protein